MKKKNCNLRYIYKIQSSRIRRDKWKFKLSIRDAMDNGELVSISDSATLRIIADINGINNTFVDSTVDSINSEIRQIKQLPTCAENRNRVRNLYEKKYDTLFVKDYVTVIIDNIRDYDRMISKKGFSINGVKYKRLYGTSGGQKKSTIVFVSENIYAEVIKRIDNGRDMSNKFVPAKLEAYRSLSSSASIPVSNPKGVLVVNDCETSFFADIIKIDDTETEYPLLTNEENHPILMNASDGFGLVLPDLSKKWCEELSDEDYIPTGFRVRHSFCKGMLFTFDFLDFAKKIAKDNTVVDAWGKNINIRDVEVVLTTSMLKLWDSYDSIEHYLKCCDENGYTFSVTKVIEKELENERNLNYQFIQSLYLSDNDIRNLIEPTMSEIEDVLGEDVMKSLLFLNGFNFDDFSRVDKDFVKALMADNRMINDPFVRNHIYKMIKKRIQEAKVGVLRVNGNFSVLSGDPYSLCQSMFGLEVTGLLKAEQMYAGYWTSKKVSRVACFRAPMTCHNNVKVMNVVSNENMDYWYKHMQCCTILNSWDTTTHALNGADFDGDSILTTDNEIILNSIKKTNAIVCIQKTANKKTVEESDLVKSNKDSFGDEIGAITNRITSMFQLLSNFTAGSEEYNELMYRITCGQNYQQNAIDKGKGIVAKSMPKEWYDYHSNKINDSDSEEVKKKKMFNMRLIADKKPYFFCYIYDGLMRQHRSFVNKTRMNCGGKFKKNVRELVLKDNKTKDEEVFLKYYFKKIPVLINDSTMNKICWRVEDRFDDMKAKFKEKTFDYRIMMTEYGFSKTRYDEVKKLYKEYLCDVNEYFIDEDKSNTSDYEKEKKRNEFKNNFKFKAESICSNEEELCNIVLEICYTSQSSKQFAWDICGDVIVKNLLAKNNYMIEFPALCKLGDIYYKGERFAKVSKNVEGLYEDNLK